MRMMKLKKTVVLLVMEEVLAELAKEEAPAEPAKEEAGVDKGEALVELVKEEEELVKGEVLEMHVLAMVKMPVEIEVQAITGVVETPVRITRRKNGCLE